MISRGQANIGVKIEDASSSIRPSITEEPFEQKQKKAKKKLIEQKTMVFESFEECNKWVLNNDEYEVTKVEPSSKHVIAYLNKYAWIK
ncbi:hypothetical protein [Halalkalibacter flavus]|uniref:hypothetical protein n=1 Tax=Halalkalibacter flavus TaxID=3090668 RepID=UPI002FC6405B